MNYRQPWHSRPFKQRWFSRYNPAAQPVRIGGVGQTREIKSCSLLKFWFKSEVKRMDDRNKTDIMKAMKLLERAIEITMRAFYRNKSTFSLLQLWF